MLKKLLLFLGLFLALRAETALAQCAPTVLDLKNDTSQIRFNIELAVTPQERSKGLMFREEMPDRSGMLFVFDPPQPVVFWMKNTLIPLDMIFVDRTGIVQRVHENAIPHDETAIFGGDDIYAVFEINAGLARRYGISPGTRLRHEIFSGGPAIWPC